MSQFIDRFRAKNTKASQAQSRIKQLAKMEVIDTPTGRSIPVKIRIPSPPHCGNEIVTLEKAGLTYNGKRWILKHVDLHIQRGEKNSHRRL